MELQTVSQVSKAFGISAQMLRYYERSGLVKSLRKEGYAYRVYDNENTKRLQQIIILRKLQIPVKQIKEILNNDNMVAVIEIFRQNISELDEQITALSTVRSILARFVDELRNEIDAHFKLEHLNDKAMFALVDVLSFSENKVKEKLSMEDLNQASEVLQKAEEKKPIIFVYPARKDAFYFLGFEQAVLPNSDFGMVWDNFFNAAERCNFGPYEAIVWYYKDNQQIYFVGKEADLDAEIPEGFSLVRFPACEYMVVTHEWLENANDGIFPTQNFCGIGQTHNYKKNVPMPDGYERFDGPGCPITQIEIENVSPKNGSRFERWVPIKPIPDKGNKNVRAN